ncbi:MAG: GH92 family glycosyl hydrolase [Bacteroidota bacterium]
MSFIKNTTNVLLSTLLGFFILTSCQQSKEKQAIDYVSPFLGTDFFGHTFPGPAVPNGMIHVGPDTGTQGWNNAAGYTWQSNSIIGFSHTHWSGVGMTNGGDILLMPTVNNKLQVVPGSEKNPDEGYRSRYNHDKESASSGYYAVALLDYNVDVELTTTQRAGFHRYTFPKSENSRIILDLGHQLGNMTSKKESRLNIIDETHIEGQRASGLGTVYFVIELSKPFKYYGTFDTDFKAPESGHGVFPYKNEESGKNIGAFFQYETKVNEQILVKVGISYTGIDGARKNLEQEIPHWDFDLTRKIAAETWSTELGKIEISGTEEQKEIFYTSMYRSLLAQYISQDVDGSYYGSDGQKHIADFNFYGSFSCWDTYRSQHPLLTIIKPEDVNDYIKSIEAKTRNYGWLPAQHFMNVFGEAMVGDHLIPVIVDAYQKGFRDYDVEFLYEAMRKKALENPEPPVPEYAGRSGLDYYKELGFTPIDKVTEAVPNTMELAYDDWCIAQLAKELGKEEDYELFSKRAGNYAMVWDVETQFMRPRLANGDWLEARDTKEQLITKVDDHSYYTYFDPLLIGRRPNRHYTESNAWQYIWSVQHDVNGLINLFGNDERFLDKLDEFFSMSTDVSAPKYVGVVGTIGQYVHGNQPSHHVAYLYNYAGQPWKTQEKVRQVLTQLYNSGPGGLCGNEDMGSLSSWYVLSAMGFYPVTPGSSNYVIGSPLLGKSKIFFRDGKTFEIIAENNSPENIYIQSVTLNGERYTKCWISHEMIKNGGNLHFVMGPEPNKSWSVDTDSKPPPITK